MKAVSKVDWNWQNICKGTFPFSFGGSMVDVAAKSWSGGGIDAANDISSEIEVTWVTVKMVLTTSRV